MLVLSAAVACQKMPDKVDADGECLVFTARSENSDFSQYSTFTVVDSVLVIDGSHSSYSKNSFASALVSEVRKMMENRGYQYVELENKENADLGLQLTYIMDTDYFTDYVGGYADSYWWLGYPGYWSPGYWGTWGGWYYPYPVTYSYSTHSLLIDMADLTSAQGEDENLPVVWNAFIDGDVLGVSYYDKERLLEGIRQAFAQSEYLR